MSFSSHVETSRKETRRWQECDPGEAGMHLPSNPVSTFVNM